MKIASHAVRQNSRMHRPGLLLVVLLLGWGTLGSLGLAVAAEPTPGILSGRVEDTETGKPLPYTNISFARTTEGLAGSVAAGGVLCDKNGRFHAPVKPGTYRLEVRYISYHNLVLQDIVVRAGETTEVVARLTPEAIKLETVKISAARLQDKEAALLDKQKKADAISDAISSEQISRSTDSNAAEAVDRVTGTTVDDGRYVYVRGLGDRYSSAQVNGSNVGAPEANKRVLPLDIFPSGVLDNIIIQKTYTPDMDGEFGGGVVNINTKQNQDRRIIENSFSLGVTGGSGGSSFRSYPGGSLDFLGVDDGTRALPGMVTQRAGSVPITRGNFTSQERADLGGSFRNVWSPSDRNQQPNFNYSGLFADKFQVAERPLGFLLSMSLSNSFRSMTKENNAYAGTAENPTPEFLYDVDESEAHVLGGITSSLNYKVNEANRLSAHILYTRDSEDRVWSSLGPNYNFGNDSVLQTELGYIERGLLSAYAKGEHDVWYEGSKLDWQLSYSKGTRNELDRRWSMYEWNPTRELYELSRRAQHPLTRIFGASDEYDRTFKANWRMPMLELGAIDPDLTVGFTYTYRNRDSWYRRFGYSPRGNRAGDRSLNPEVFVTQENLDAQNTLFDELTLPNDSWDANQYLTALYGMVDTRLDEQIRLVAGARVEQSSQSAKTGSPYSGESGSAAQDVLLEGTDVLPAANLTWNMSKRQNLRVAWSRTLARPQLRELSPFDMFNYEYFYTEVGNPELQYAHLTHYDLRWEMYPSPREFLSVGLFHKKMHQPIQTLLTVRVTQEALTPVNGDEGELTGAEFEIRAGMGRFWQVLGAKQPAWLHHWGITANYSRVNSSVRYNTTSIPLTGQSTYSFNAGIFYGTPRFHSNLMYKTAGKRLHAFTAGVLPDVYAFPMQNLDFTCGANLSRKTALKFQFENILNEPMTFKQGDLVVRRWLPGRTISLSMRYSI